MDLKFVQHHYQMGQKLDKKIYYKLNAERMYDKNISLDIFYSKFDHNDSTSTDTIK